MNLLSTESLSKAYGEKKLFDKVAFGIDDSDKIGLIGINGTGKTSFLKVIAGIDEADAGNAGGNIRTPGRAFASCGRREGVLPQLRA